MKQDTQVTELKSPLGPMVAAAREGALVGLWFIDQQYVPERAGWRRDDQVPVLRDTARQVTAYFAGERRVFELPLAPEGTPFQKKVWDVIAAIPYGETIAYGDLAARLGLKLTHARAAGAATGRNPISLIVPCHRIVGADGSLTGYAGGLERKRQLLAMERGDDTVVQGRLQLARQRLARPLLCAES
jgi:methylated-DNA-[protein]-cysteine S-methyltransferase